jgi:hypothetical protein
MNETNSENGLKNALAKFETCVETPVVPGELARWTEDARQAFDDVARCLREETHSSHLKLLGEMARQDAEMQERVQQLGQCEKQLMCDLETVELKLAQLADRSAAVEPDEAKMRQPIADFVDLSLAFVLSARKQDTAIATWYAEAFNRDRGVAD